MLSKQIASLEPSPTLALAAKAKALKAQGKDIISLTVGEPDWATYDEIKEAGIQAIRSNKTRYTPAAGIPELRSAIAGMISKQTGVDYKSEQVTVASGAKYIIYGALFSLCDPGDEVLIPSPYWVSYPTMVTLAGGRPITVKGLPENGFKVTAQQLADAATEKTKVLMLNSPSNPTGSEYTEPELSAIADLIKKNPRWVVLSDDIYNQLSYTGREVSPHLLNVAPELEDRVLCINGMSKAYAMTGWRVGWAVGPTYLTKAMGSFQSQTTGAPCSISQWAAVTGLLECAPQVQSVGEELIQRRDVFIDLVKQIPNVECFVPSGAFYLWLDVRAWLGKTYKDKVLKTTRDVAAALLDHFLVAVVAGYEFGMDGFLRLSFAASEQDLRRAQERFVQFASALKS